MPNFIQTTVDPARLSTIANNISENIGQVEAAVKQMRQTLSEDAGSSLKATWTGPASKEFYTQFAEDAEIFNSYLKVLQTLNDQLREAAGIFDNADVRVRELINQLKIG